MDYAVYALVDPRTKDVRYIGVTRQNGCRKTSHENLASARRGSRLAAWFDELEAAGLAPEFVVLSTFGGWMAQSSALLAERRAIKRYASADDGHLILNIANNPRFKIVGKGKARAIIEVPFQPRLQTGRQRIIEAFGRRQGIAAWARELGISRQRLHQRLKNQPPEVALSTKKKNQREAATTLVA